MAEHGFCPYKQKSEHALATIISLYVFLWGCKTLFRLCRFNRSETARLHGYLLTLLFI